ncbi:MAG TPA: N-acetylmuramoyl-L-alanine amidase [Chthoniobacterales bacterium]|jgi:N-acetylmuramoyl-L-alanine amidase
MPASPSKYKRFPLKKWWFLVLWAVLLFPCQAATWEIVTAHGRQYIPLRNLKDFYGLANVPADEPGQVRLQGSKGVLDFRSGSRECAINGVRIWLSFPALQTESGWLVSRMDVAKTIEPALRPAIIKGLSSVTTVVLDAGHGGHDHGAASRYGWEKAFSLDISRRVKNKLVAGGYNVVMTRDTDIFLPLHARSAIANKIPDSIFVSIHFNASSNGDAASGIEVFSMAPRGAPSTNDNFITWASLRESPGHELDMASFALGRSVHTALVGHLQPVDRGLKRARFAVIRTARVPAILVECGFLTNFAEARAIATDAHRNSIATAIAEGISDYKLLATLHKPPKSLADYNRPIDTKITLRADAGAGINTEADGAPAPVVSPGPVSTEVPGPAALPLSDKPLILLPPATSPEIPLPSLPFSTNQFPLLPRPSGSHAPLVYSHE